MAVTKEQFKQFIRPQPGEVVFFVDNGYDVEAINISTKLDSKVNVYGDLKLMTTMSLDLNDERRDFFITSRALVSGISGSYWNFEVTPTDITLDSNPVDSTNPSVGRVELDIVPRPADYRFNRSDYEVLGSTVQENRTTPFIFDVDASYDGINPINKQAILNNSASPAQFQELNHTSTGLVNARYIGSKTTPADFGISPSISATPFKASIYPLNLSNRIICSQSFQERTVQDLLFSFDPGYFENALADTGISELDIDNLVNPSPRTNIISTQVAQFTVGNNPSAATRANIIVTGSVNLKPQDILLYSGSDGQEYLRVNSATYTRSTNSSLINVQLKALEKYGETNIYPTSGRANRTGAQTAGDTIFKISSDTVFNTDQNQLFKVVNRKIYNIENQEIVIVDDSGKVILISANCSV